MFRFLDDRKIHDTINRTGVKWHGGWDTILSMSVCFDQTREVSI